MNRQDTKRILKTILSTFAIVIVVGYAVFASHSFIQGPHITLEEPANGSTIATSSTVIRGVALRAQEITLNGKPILIDDVGNFKETVLLSPGYNVETINVKDKFGRSKEYRLELVYEVK